MSEKLANKGYCIMGKETVLGTAVTPTVAVPIYSESIVTNHNYDMDTPIIGIAAARYRVLQGQRDHQGTFKAIAEPNTLAYIFDMLLAHGAVSTSGNENTYAYTLADSNSYTIDFLKGDMVFRYRGVKAKQIKSGFEGNKMTVDVEVAAMGEFSTREIASISGSGPYTITLKTNYDLQPALGLVVADVMQAYDVSEGTTVNFIVDTVEAGNVAITCSEDVSALAAGDLIYIRAQTPTYATITPFTFGRMEFRFSDTASNALSATHTPVEKDSSFTIKHDILPSEGAKRSGSLDPASLPRGTGDIMVDVTRFFADGQEHNRLLTLGTRALVIRCFSELIDSNYAELRITVNSYEQSEAPKSLTVGELIMEKQKLAAHYKSADSQMFDVKIINKVATV